MAETKRIEANDKLERLEFLLDDFKAEYFMGTLTVFDALERLEAVLTSEASDE